MIALIFHKGSDLLVKPVTSEGATSISVYLPDKNGVGTFSLKVLTILMTSCTGVVRSR